MLRRCARCRCAPGIRMTPMKCRAPTASCRVCTAISRSSHTCKEDRRKAAKASQDHGQPWALVSLSMMCAARQPGHSHALGGAALHQPAAAWHLLVISSYQTFMQYTYVQTLSERAQVAGLSCSPCSPCRQCASQEWLSAVQPACRWQHQAGGGAGRGPAHPVQQCGPGYPLL